jgi:hypothetical protein
MRKISAFLLLTFSLGACASGVDSAQTDSTQLPAANESTASAESAPSENSAPASAAREAVLSEFESEVVAKQISDGEYIPAEVGFVIQTGGGLQTGANGRARLDLNPEGTIVRVAPNSAFTLPEIANDGGEPKTGIELFFGKIFVLLNGGSLDVQTPSGVASVRGSLLSVSFDPASGRLQAACLEGHCALINGDGVEVELEEGKSGYIDESGEIVEFDGIDRDEILDWLEEAPELGEFLEELPDPDAFPEIEDFEAFEFDPLEFFGETENESGDGFFNFDEENPPDDNDSTEDPGDAGESEDDTGDGNDEDSGGDP